MRRLILAALVLFGLVGELSAKDYIRLASWNIENLGKRDFGQNRFAIADYLNLAGMDVLALQEIHDIDGRGAPYKNDKLKQVLDLLNEQDGHSWKYELFPKRNPNQTRQLCGIAWNSARVKKIGGTYKIPVDHRNDIQWKRHPHAVKFQALGADKNDFVVISVHMKSNVRDEHDPLSPVDRRASEADALADAFDKITSHFQDEDVIVIGDTNCKSANEEALTILKGVGLKDLNEKEGTTYSSRASFDHILVPDSQQEFRYSKQYILTPSDPSGFDKAVSDHFLVMTSIQILDDDDGGADGPVGIRSAVGNLQYYDGVDPTADAADFRESLHRLIRNNRVFSYRQLWDALQYTDESEQDVSKVVLFYTGWELNENNHGGNPAQWNREHVWAKSKGDFGTRPGAGTDLHHIRPTDVSVNGRRGSLSFDNGGQIYNDPDGQTTNRVSDTSWEPRDEVKGDVARMLFYMAVRYEDGLDLELVDQRVPESSKKPKIGKLSTLLQWHAADPPSAFEKRRNNRIHELQGNRNPFIDHPEWVEKIWSTP